MLVAFFPVLPDDPYGPEMIRRMKQKSVDEFERRSLDYAKGFLAAKLGRKPLWLARFALKYGYLGEVAQAASSVIEKQGGNPYTCGLDLNQDLPRTSDIRLEVQAGVESGHAR